MAFVKRHLFLLICGLAALVSIVFSVLGIRGMNDIPVRMQAGAALEGQIRSLSSGPSTPDGERLPPINAAAIEARKKNIAAIQENHNNILAKVKEINNRPMLLAAVFPTTTNVQDAFTFKTKYDDAMKGLLDLLKAGAPPTSKEVEDMDALMEAASAPAPNEQGVLSDSGNRRSNSRAAANAGRSRPRAAQRSSSRNRALSAEEARNAVKEDPAVRAAVAKARSIRCYASPASFDVVPMPQGAPRDTEMWHAQMTYLVQRDIVDAIARVNEMAAQAMPKPQGDEKNESPWVGVMPVKDVLSIQVGGGELETMYVGSLASEEGARRRGGRGGHVGGAPLEVAAAFTQRGSSALYDVIRFTVRLVVDSRDALLVLNEISKSNFFVPFNVNYVATRSTPGLAGKVYGSEPTVELRIDLDGYYFRNAYLDYMPPKVRAMVGAE